MTDETCSFQPIEVGHADVHDDDVGLELERFLDGIMSVDGLTTDLIIGLGREQGHHATADYFVVIDDEDSHRSAFPQSGEVTQ
jgi:hypothetical protein